MKSIFLLLILLFCYDEIVAQIDFEQPKDYSSVPTQIDGKANKLFEKLNINDLSSSDEIPLMNFFARNQAIFSSIKSDTTIDSDDFIIFLSSFNFNNLSTVSKRTLIKQGIIYFTERKPILELANLYLSDGKFDLRNFEIDFFKKLAQTSTESEKEKNLHFLISFVEIFEHWDDYNEYLKPNEFAIITENDIDGLKNLVNRYMNTIIEQDFFMYSYVNSSKKLAKSIYIDHGNDFLLPINNRDRDMTGSFRVELTTDLLKMRIFTKPNRSDILSYQSLFFGGEAYTPFIRYNPENIVNNGNIDILKSKYSYGLDKTGKYDEAFINNYLLPVSNMIQRVIDRPFASFQYIGRAKYRIPVHGLWRYIGEVKLGSIGKNLGRDIQSAIHQDLNPSIKVLNWDNQIGAPGRLAIEVHLRHDRLIFSNGNQVKLNAGNYKEENTHLPNFLNLYYFGEANTGTIQNAISLGLGFSNRNFRKQSGQKETKFYSRLPLQNFYLSFESKLKYQLHNSLLEGLGFFKPFNNTTKSGVNPDNFVLSKSDVKKIVWFNDLKVSYRVNKVAISYTATVNSQEFYNKDYKNYNEKYKDSKKSVEDYLKFRFINDFSESITPTQRDFAELLLENPEIGGKIDIPKFHFIGTFALNFFIN